MSNGFPEVNLPESNLVEKGVINDPDNAGDEIKEVKEKILFDLDDGTQGSRSAFIRQEFLKGRSRSEIAKELQVSYNIVFAATANMDNGTVGSVGRKGALAIIDGELAEKLGVEPGTSRKDYILQRIKEGVTRKQIAEELGVSYGVIYGVTKALEGVKADRSGSRAMIEYPAGSGEMRPRTELIRELYNQVDEEGNKLYTRRNIADLLRVDYNVVWQATKEVKVIEPEAPADASEASEGSGEMRPRTELISELFKQVSEVSVEVPVDEVVEDAGVTTEETNPKKRRK